MLSILLSLFPKNFFSEQSAVEIYVKNAQISLGTSYISVRCKSDRMKSSFLDKNSRNELFLQCRQNKTNDWETIVQLNDSGSFITNISTAIETHLVRNKTCDYRSIKYEKGCRIYANISIHLETCKDYLNPSFRCQFVDIDTKNAVDVSDEVQVQITSK